METSLKRRLMRGDLLIGTIVSLPSPEIAEILSICGFDWLFIDLEHSALTIKDAQAILQVASPKTPCVIRVPTHDETWIKKSLDIGASGIIVPQVLKPEEAECVVKFCKYPPQGNRSVGLSRAQSYGANFDNYILNANDQIAVIIQIEHIDAVQNADKILQVPGIDCVFIGPYDLSASMGKIGNVTDPEVQQAISQVKKSADNAKIPLGIFGANETAVKPYIENGFRLITAGTDIMLLRNSAKIMLELLKKF